MTIRKHCTGDAIEGMASGNNGRPPDLIPALLAASISCVVFFRVSENHAQRDQEKDNPHPAT